MTKFPNIEKLKIAKYKGFTLIELLVTMAVVGILAATAIVNFGKNEDRDVRQEKDRLTSFLREVQNKALAGERQNISISNKVCGFGFRKTGSNVESFYVSTTDLNGDCAVSWGTYTKTAYETFSPSNGTAVTFSGNVFFISPSGAVVCDGCVLPTSLTITKGSSSISATIDNAGRIY
ncbi:MAG: type II secretion system protein [Parcubacteria group bacterium]|jgi:prepilin-type N-terminal cleavage/methylation domain-containing protein